MQSLIGKDAQSPLVFAPLAGISDSVCRTLAHEQGAAFSYTEMVSAKGLYYKSPGSEELLYLAENEGPVGVQIFGSEPSMIAFAADYLKDRPFAFIDINMGCPVPKVVKNHEGSALLKDPDLAARIVEAAAEHGGGKPVTVKMRIGFEGVAQDCKYNYVDFAKRLENAGASAIAVHARTREQYYSGSAYWPAIADIVKAVRVPVIGNGDVQNAEDAKRMLSETGCSTVMIGRAALGNPWIFAEWQDPKAAKRFRTSAEIASTMERHFLMLKELRGEHLAVLQMRKFFGWYTKGIRGAAELRRQVNTAETADELIKYINQAAGFADGPCRA